MNKPLRVFVLAALLLVLSVAGASLGFGQIIENPAKPRAANAGRIVVPKEVVAISDEGTTAYYFKRPNNLRTGPNGTLVLGDEDQILLFDKDGNFRHNFFKKGQGPGELTYARICIPSEKSVIVQSSYPDKLIFFDYAGKFEREIRIGSIPASRRPQSQLLLADGERYLLKAWDSPLFKGVEPEFVDIPRMIAAVDAATGDVRALATFLTKSYILAAPGGGGAGWDVTDLFAVPFKEKSIALAHTEEYLLKIYDPVANKVVKEFRRRYERAKPEPLTEKEKRGGPMIGNKLFTRPELKYQNDIKNILTRNDEIWAVTSTQDKAKGVLIDVFDGEGVYRDCFWLKLAEPALASVLSPGKCALDGEFLWVVERAEDETFSIKKYRVAI